MHRSQKIVEDEHTPDADRAWWGLNAVCLLTLGPDADKRMAAFITSSYADKAGALVFACLLQLSGDSSGARFWWRFTAGFGHPVAEYCLFLEHAHSGEYDDAGHWRTELLRHGFVPDLWCGDRSTAPCSARRAWTRSAPTSSTSTTRRSAPFPFPPSAWSASYVSSPPCSNHPYAPVTRYAWLGHGHVSATESDRLLVAERPLLWEPSFSAGHNVA